MRKVFAHCGAVIPATRKTGHISISLLQQGRFPWAPLRVVFSFPLFCPRCLLVRCTLWLSTPQSFLGACTTHVYGRCAAIIIEYLQTAAETVARDSIGEDVNLRSHFSSEQFWRLAWQRISALEVDRSDLAQ